MSRTALVVAALAGAAAIGIAFAPPESQASLARLGILALGIVAAWRVLGRSSAVTAPSPELFEAELARPAAQSFEIAGLRAVETDLRMATSNAYGRELRLKPILRELAGWRLARNHGIDLDRAPEAARRILGEPLWELVRPADALPDFRAPGVPLADVQAGIDRLERI
ncbi:MAG TPA: hypothetical protein VMQ65_08785 [Candidatus Limnocylindria bacterium]|nr:hypothetical protein [Candidatus Limnocylindria bacterium]